MKEGRERFFLGGGAMYRLGFFDFGVYGAYEACPPLDGNPCTCHVDR